MEEMNEEIDKENCKPELESIETSDEKGPKQEKESQFLKLPFMQGQESAMEVIDCLMKKPIILFGTVYENRMLLKTFLTIFTSSIIFFSLYGFAMGVFGGIDAGFMVAGKLPIIFAGTFLLMLPSFYVFGSLTGADFKLFQATTILYTQSIASSLVLVATAPISGFFAASTGGETFMAILHFVFITVAVIFGIGFMLRGMRMIKNASGNFRGSGGLLIVWTIIYLFVLCQMFYVMSPLMSEGAFFNVERKLFFEALL